MRGDYGFDSKINTTHPGVHPTIWTLALLPKIWIWQSHLYFQHENSEFDLLDKVQASCLGTHGGNKTYCGPLWHRPLVSNKRRNFWNRFNNSSQINQIQIFNMIQKNPLPPLPPHSTGLKLKYVWKNCKIQLPWGGFFEFLRENGVFAF